jgi:hypothetical protein
MDNYRAFPTICLIAYYFIDLTIAPDSYRGLLPIDLLAPSINITNSNAPGFSNCNQRSGNQLPFMLSLSSARRPMADCPGCLPIKSPR